MLNLDSNPDQDRRAGGLRRGIRLIFNAPILKTQTVLKIYK